jgi:hypothetical protein
MLDRCWMTNRPIAVDPRSEGDAVARGSVTMMRHLRFVWLRRRALRALRRAAARGNPNWQREDLYERRVS